MVTLRQDIESGASLSGALAKHPKIFSELFVAMIRAGETGGFLESALLRVADQLEAQHKLRRQVKSAMVYPAVVSSRSRLCVVVAMLIFIIPVFAGVFKQFGGHDAVTHGAHDRRLERAASPVVLLPLRLARDRVRLPQVEDRPRRGRPVWDRFRLKAPAKIGTIVQKIALARWARTLSSLTAAGVPMLEAIDVTGRTAGNIIVENAMTAVTCSVQGGGTIASAPGR